MGAGFVVIVNRIVTKIFGRAGIDEQRAGLHRRFNETEHGAPVVLSGHLC